MENWLEQALALSDKVLRPSSRKVYESMWRSFCEKSRPYLDSSGQLTEVGLGRTLERLGSYSTRKRQFTQYKWVVETLIDSGRSLRNPCHSFEAEFSEEVRKIHEVAPLNAQVEAMAWRASEVSGWKGKRLVAIVRVLGDTGLRRDEVRSLLLENVEILSGGDMAIWAGKKATQRRLVVTQATKQAVQEWLSMRPECRSNLLFIADESGAAMDPSTLWRQLRRLEKDAGALDEGLSGTTAFRAAFAAKLRAEGKSEQEIRKALGHRQQLSTDELLERVLPRPG